MILLRDLTAVEKPHLKTGTREQKIVRQTTCLTIIHNFLCDLSVRPLCTNCLCELSVRTITRTVRSLAAISLKRSYMRVLAPLKSYLGLAL